MDPLSKSGPALRQRKWKPNFLSPCTDPSIPTQTNVVADNYQINVVTVSHIINRKTKLSLVHTIRILHSGSIQVPHLACLHKSIKLLFQCIRDNLSLCMLEVNTFENMILHDGKEDQRI